MSKAEKRRDEPGFAAAGSSRPDDVVTAVAAGVLGATLAALCHETLGHGIGCIAVGGRITLLTSIWFRCHGATALTDAGGAIAGLLFGCLALMTPLRFISDPATRLTVLMFGAISLLWVAAQLIFHPAFDRDDWHFIALRMHWPWIWRPIMMIVGIAAYATIMRWTFVLLHNAAAPNAQAVRVAYIASAGSATIAGAMWARESTRSAVEALQTLGVAPLGLLIAARLARPRRSERAGAPTIVRSWRFVTVSIVTFAIFGLLQGQGLGPLAKVALPHQ